jgi:hypothetical protein
MGSGERVVVRIGLGNHFVETTVLRGDERTVLANRNSARQFAVELRASGISLTDPPTSNGGWLIGDVPVAPILGFVAAFSNHPLSLLTDPGPIGNYIRDRQDDELALWDVFIPSISREEDTFVDDLLGIRVNCQRRSAGKRSDANAIYVTNKQRVASRGAEKVGLPEALVAEAESEYRRDQIRTPEGTVNFPDRIYRTKRIRPLLILHLLNILKEDVRQDSKADVRQDSKAIVAWSVSFPLTMLPEQRVEYVVTTTWLRENFRADVDEEEAEDVDV